MSEQQQLEVWQPEVDVEVVVPDTMPVLSIEGPTQYLYWTDRLSLIKAFQKKVVEWYRGTDEKPGPLKRAYQSYQQLLEREKESLKPAADEEAVIKAAILAYDDALERVRLATERAEQEAARLAEQDRLLNEAIALEEAQKVDPLLADDAAAALAALDQPVHTPSVYVPSARPKQTGTTIKANWKARRDTFDVKKLARGVLAGKYSEKWLLPNWELLDAYAKSTEGTHAVDGISFFNDRNVSQRAKR